MTIEKKVWPQYFEKILTGDKNFELRLNDFECNEGDILLLKEWNPETKDYTGRSLEKKIRCIFRTKGQTFWSDEDVEKYGYQIISF